MQNDPDPLRRITVTNSWAEANLMNTLRQWRTEAEKRGYTRIAELADYLQADERTHVRLATDWIQKLTEDNPAHRDELVSWGRQAIARIQDFHSSRYREMPDPSEARFTFLKPNSHAEAAALSPILGE
jgi:rubrerythrin